MGTSPEQNRENFWCINNGVRGFDMSSLPRCTAIAKSTGRQCQRPAKKGKPFCGIHDGSFRPGAPPGNSNAWKHGLYSQEAIEERGRARDFNISAQDLVRDILFDM